MSESLKETEIQGIAVAGRFIVSSRPDGTITPNAVVLAQVDEKDEGGKNAQQLCSWVRQLYADSQKLASLREWADELARALGKIQDWHGTQVGQLLDKLDN